MSASLSRAAPDVVMLDLRGLVTLQSMTALLDRCPVFGWSPPLGGGRVIRLDGAVTLLTRDAVHEWAAALVGRLREDTRGAVVVSAEQEPDFDALSYALAARGVLQLACKTVRRAVAFGQGRVVED